MDTSSCSGCLSDPTNGDNFSRDEFSNGGSAQQGGNLSWTLTKRPMTLIEPKKWWLLSKTMRKGYNDREPSSIGSNPQS